MEIMIMIKSRLLMWLCVTVVLFSSGCASVRVLTDLKPDENAELQSPAGKFYVARLKYVSSFNGCIDLFKKPNFDVNYEKRLLRLVRQECLTRYPLLFVQDEANAIPLEITVSDGVSSQNGDGKSFVWMLCTLTISGVIFPLPMGCDRDIDVSLGVFTGGDAKGNTIQQTFYRKQRAWGSLLLPLGLIDVPGESDFPKESAVHNPSPFLYDDVPQVAQQVATAIAKGVATKDQEFWTAQPRATVQPVFSPANPSPVPLTPLPIETVTPF